MSFLSKTDPQLAKILKDEIKRQNETLMMIPSENHTSEAVREAVGSCLQDKYCEGYPYRRYYQGQENFDKLETLCRERIKKAFGVPYVNVQPLSGAPANTAVYFALLKPGDKMMGLRLDQGGHITHGLAINYSGVFYKNIFYHVGKDGQIDYQAMASLAKKEKPKIIIAGITSFPLALDFKKFSQIAESVDALLMADMSHVAGLILAGSYPNPVPYVHIITTTTHKTIRGPRGAIIMVTQKGLKKDPEMGVKIDKAVFPGLQGGPHENNIAGIAVAFKEAGKPAFIRYGKQIVRNAKVLAESLKKKGLKLCSGGTNTHLILIDLMGSLNISGKLGAEALEAAGIITNYNGIPYDPNPPFFPSGLRLGTPAITSQGMKEKQMEQIADWIYNVLKDISKIKKELKVSFDQEKNKIIREKIIKKSREAKKVKVLVRKLCRRFPIKKKY